MAFFTIPTEGSEETPNFDFRVLLDGTEYTMQFRYNDRAEAWSFNVLTSDAVVLRAGVGAVENFPLLRRVAEEAWQGGLMYFFDGRAVTMPPGLDDLGVTASLTYEEAD